MALSQLARDILASLPTDSFVEADTPSDMSIEVPSDSVISEYTIIRICEIFRNIRHDPVRCSVDLTRHTIHLKTGGCVFTEPIYHKCDLVASTESEKTAVQIADNLGTVDHDDLVPHFAMNTDEKNTVLKLANLLHVSHDAILHYTRGTPNIQVQYDMSLRTVCLLIPRHNKRKR